MLYSVCMKSLSILTHTPALCLPRFLRRPICDGHEATRRIRDLIAAGKAPDTPILALSASCSDEEARWGAAKSYSLPCSTALCCSSLQYPWPFISFSRPNML